MLNQFSPLAFSRLLVFPRLAPFFCLSVVSLFVCLVVCLFAGLFFFSVLQRSKRLEWDNYRIIITTHGLHNTILLKTLPRFGVRRVLLWRQKRHKTTRTQRKTCHLWQQRERCTRQFTWLVGKKLILSLIGWDQVTEEIWIKNGVNTFKSKRDISLSTKGTHLFSSML